MTTKASPFRTNFGQDGFWEKKKRKVWGSRKFCEKNKGDPEESKGSLKESAEENEVIYK